MLLGLFGLVSLTPAAWIPTIVVNDLSPNGSFPSTPGVPLRFAFLIHGLPSNDDEYEAEWTVAAVPDPRVVAPAFSTNVTTGQDETSLVPMMLGEYSVHLCVRNISEAVNSSFPNHDSIACHNATVALNLSYPVSFERVASNYTSAQLDPPAFLASVDGMLCSVSEPTTHKNGTLSVISDTGHQNASLGRANVTVVAMTPFERYLYVVTTEVGSSGFFFSVYGAWNPRDFPVGRRHVYSTPLRGSLAVGWKPTGTMSMGRTNLAYVGTLSGVVVLDVTSPSFPRVISGLLDVVPVGPSLVCAWGSAFYVVNANWGVPLAYHMQWVNATTNNVTQTGAPVRLPFNRLPTAVTYNGVANQESPNDSTPLLSRLEAIFSNGQYASLSGRTARNFSLGFPETNMEVGYKTITPLGDWHTIIGTSPVPESRAHPVPLTQQASGAVVVRTLPNQPPMIVAVLSNVCNGTCSVTTNGHDIFVGGTDSVGDGFLQAYHVQLENYTCGTYDCVAPTQRVSHAEVTFCSFRTGCDNITCCWIPWTEAPTESPWTAIPWTATPGHAAVATASPGSSCGSFFCPLGSSTHKWRVCDDMCNATYCCTMNSTPTPSTDTPVTLSLTCRTYLCVDPLVRVASPDMVTCMTGTCTDDLCCIRPGSTNNVVLYVALACGLCVATLVAAACIVYRRRRKQRIVREDGSSDRAEGRDTELQPMANPSSPKESTVASFTMSVADPIADPLASSLLPSDFLKSAESGGGSWAPVAAPESPDPGYEKVLTLGKGAFGTVYLVRTPAGEYCAVKEEALDAVAASVSLALVVQMKTLQHENLVRIMEGTYCAGKLRLLMEYIDGESLGDKVRKLKRRLSESEAARYTGQILAALQYLHGRAFVHRDVKADNVLISTAGSAKLCDYGCLKVVRGTTAHGSAATVCNTVVGSPNWMAPEVMATGDHFARIGPPADLYSLGCTVSEILNEGVPPGDRSTNVWAALGRVQEQIEALDEPSPDRAGLPPNVVEGASPEAFALISSCLRRNPEERPTAQALIDHAFIKQPPPKPRMREPAEAAGLTEADMRTCELVPPALGRGSFGKVYLGLVGGTQAVAVKVVDLAGLRSSRLREGLVGEYAVLESLAHPNIVQCFGSQWRDATTLHVFLQYMGGGSVRQLVAVEGRLSEERVRHIARQVLMGLNFLHRGGKKRTPVAHRDVKGDNLLLDESKTQVRLADFGCSKVMGGAEGTFGGTGAQTYVGTPFWMAPEVLRQRTVVSPRYGTRCDLWSLGCTVVEMLGLTPWREGDESVAEVTQRILASDEGPPIPSDVSAELRALLLLCFVRDPAGRANATTLLNTPFFTSEVGDCAETDEETGELPAGVILAS